MNRYEVHARHDWPSGAIEIALVDRSESWPAIGRPDVHGYLVPHAVERPEVGADPTMRLSPSEARELWLQLGRIVAEGEHGHDHTREDYLHERGRVDRLLGALLGEGQG